MGVVLTTECAPVAQKCRNVPVTAQKSGKHIFFCVSRLLIEETALLEQGKVAARDGQVVLLDIATLGEDFG